MMEIRYKTKAIRQIKKIRASAKRLPKKSANSQLIRITPFQVSRYKTTPLLKFRVKNWRVFFTAALEIVEVQEVKKRNERTYK